MIVDVALPIHGLTITEARVARWLKRPGDRVEKGEGLLEMETDKAVEAIESPASGWLLAYLANEGDVVPLGKIVGKVGTEAGDRWERVPEEPATPSKAPEASRVGVTTLRSGARETPGGSAKASPRARRAARRLGVDLAKVPGTGRGGLHIRERDVLAAAQAAATRPPGRGHSAIRQTAARRLQQSFRDAPHFYLTREVNAERLCVFREDVIARSPAGSPRVTFTDLFLRALALSLRAHPAMNARWEDDGPVEQPGVAVGLAVETPEGLVAPVLRDLDRVRLSDAAKLRDEVVARARSGRLTVKDVDGGSFTLTNLGPLGVDQFQAVINPPQCGILAVGSIRPRPFAAEGRLAVARTVFLTLSVDHRIADGAGAARFLQHVAGLVEGPETM